METDFYTSYYLERQFSLVPIYRSRQNRLIYLNSRLSLRTDSELQRDLLPLLSSDSNRDMEILQAILTLRPKFVSLVYGYQEIHALPLEVVLQLGADPNHVLPNKMAWVGSLLMSSKYYQARVLFDYGARHNFSTIIGKRSPLNFQEEKGVISAKRLDWLAYLFSYSREHLVAGVSSSLYSVSVVDGNAYWAFLLLCYYQKLDEGQIGVVNHYYQMGLALRSKELEVLMLSMGATAATEAATEAATAVTVTALEDMTYLELLRLMRTKGPEAARWNDSNFWRRKLRADYAGESVCLPDDSPRRAYLYQGLIPLLVFTFKGVRRSLRAFYHVRRGFLAAAAIVPSEISPQVRGASFQDDLSDDLLGDLLEREHPNPCKQYSLLLGNREVQFDELPFLRGVLVYLRLLGQERKASNLKRYVRG